VYLPSPPFIKLFTSVCLAILFSGMLSAQAPPPPRSAPTTPLSELDAFMEKVLARREVNRKTLEQYILDEVEEFEVLGPGRWPLYRTRREYSWYMRDGMHVRSPLKFNGVSINEEARTRYETRWIARERARQERKKKGEKESGEVSIGSEGVQISGGAVIPTEPRFVSEAYFMDFKFEAGNYYLAGREQLEGHEVLKIEYYPTRLFGDDDDRREGRQEKVKEPAEKSNPDRNREKRKEKDVEQDIERRMNKTALVTLWVDQAEHQIVKYTFDNVWLDFLPAAWLVRIDDIRASMTMGQPFPGVWLPRQMNVHAGVTLANGSFEAGYGRRFTDYRLAEVSTKIRIPKQTSAIRPRPAPPPAAVSNAVEVESGSGPFVVDQDGQAPKEMINEIRIHGNAFVTDKEVLDLAGVTVGQPLAPDAVETITARLKNSGKFETIDVRKRQRSLTDTSDIALVLLVHEKPGVRSEIGGVDVPGVPAKVARPVGWLRSKLMFLPIIGWVDGYGFTYGGRVSTVDLLGMNERLSVPLTWGGTRRAALEFERGFKTGPLTRIDSSFGIWNRENPRFEIRDQRVELKGRAERVFGDILRTGVDASHATVSFGAIDDRLWTLGTSARVDTRIDPSFPANAVLVDLAWNGLNFRSVPDRINRYTVDTRGYLRVFRQIVVAGRAAYVGADATLPPYERLLLGGSSSVRGFRTGALDGDRTLVTSLEARAPITSVLNGAKLGFNVFLDSSKIWNVGQKVDAVDWHRGVGGGVFLIASILRLNLDVAHGLKTGDTRVHLSSGFTF
jgi:hypothetical protein